MPLHTSYPSDICPRKSKLQGIAVYLREDDGTLHLRNSPDGRAAGQPYYLLTAGNIGALNEWAVASSKHTGKTYVVCKVYTVAEPAALEELKNLL